MRRSAGFGLGTSMTSRSSSPTMGGGPRCFCARSTPPRPIRHPKPPAAHPPDARRNRRAALSAPNPPARRYPSQDRRRDRDPAKARPRGPHPPRCRGRPQPPHAPIRKGCTGRQRTTPSRHRPVPPSWFRQFLCVRGNRRPNRLSGSGNDNPSSDRSRGADFDPPRAASKLRRRPAGERERAGGASSAWRRSSSACRRTGKTRPISVADPEPPA